jgi:hypothetical protein
MFLIHEIINSILDPEADYSDGDFSLFFSGLPDKNNESALE